MSSIASRILVLIVLVFLEQGRSFFHCQHCFGPGLRRGRTISFRTGVVSDGNGARRNDTRSPFPPPTFLAPVYDGLQASPQQASQSKAIIPTHPDAIASLTTDQTEKILNTGSKDAIRYFRFIEELAPNEMLKSFSKTAPLHVQEAAKTTVMNIFGSLPNYALDASLLTTSAKLANLLYQMQITGYMFKNAEYRMSLTRTLKGLPKPPPPATLLTEKGESIDIIQEEGQVEGEVRFRSSRGDEFSVDVQELTSALSREVTALRKELAAIRSQRENELKANLLTYIQALPEKEMQRLTADMSGDILQAIQLIVNALMEKLGVDSQGPEVVLQQSVTQLAQLCMWQMVVGYKLRELEALEKGASYD
eukprot:gene11208-12500_t